MRENSQHPGRLYKLVLTLCVLVSCFPDKANAQARRTSLARADRMEMQAKQLYDEGHYEEGIQLEVRVLGIRVKLLGPGDPAVAVALDNLAALYEDKGDYARAEQLLDLAWQIAERTLPPEHTYSTRIRNNRASMYDDRGDYTRAKQLYQGVLTLREKAASDRPIDAALSQLCKRNSGTPEECQRHLDVALTLNDLAAVHEHEGDYDQAEGLFKRALEKSEQLLPPDHLFILQLLNNLAVVYDQKDDKAQAEQLFQRVLDIRLRTLGDKHPKVALSLNNLAALFVRIGNFTRAEESLNRALGIAREALPADHVDVALILGNLAALAMAKAEYGKAVGWLAQATAIQEHHLSLILAIGSETQKQRYLDTLVNETNQAVSLDAISVPHDEATELALTTVLQRKGRTLDAMTDQLNILRRKAAPQDRRLLYQLQAVGTRLANRQVSGPGRIQLAASWRAAVARDSAEFERLEREIGRRSAAFRAQAVPVSLEAVREQIPANAALIEFFEYLPFNPSGRNEATRWGAPHYVAYVVRRDKPLPQEVQLGEAARINEKVKLLRAALRNPAREDTDDLARALDESVMQPIRRVLGNTHHLLLSPDGALNLVPFAALVDERGQYLVQDYSLTYLTSGRDLLRLKEEVANESQGSRPLVIADPFFDMHVPLPAANSRKRQTLPIRLEQNRRSSEWILPKFAPLHGTRDEAIALAKLLPEARVLTQTQATESSLKQVHGPSILHIATHGYFLPDNPHPSIDGRPNATRDNQLEPAQTQISPNENPLLRSGLVFSGGNHLQGGNREDGILTGLEAAGLNLSGTKLVVLSACETGLGNIQNGNGVYGLRRALVLAGSESQLMSLWKVNDEITRDLMIRYYNLLLTGKGRSEALRRVQLEMLARKGDSQGQSHPYFWAGFIQSGQWKNMAGRETE